jgi:hypothetical protein
LRKGAREWLIQNLRSQGREAEIAGVEPDDGKPSVPVAADAANHPDDLAGAELSEFNESPGDSQEAAPGSGTTVSTLVQSAKTDDLILLQRLALLLVEGRDSDGYRQLCHKVLAQFSATTEATAARRVAKASLLAPLPAEDTEIAARLAEYALTHSTGPKFIIQAWLGKGLAEYRCGNHAAALPWMEKILADPQTGSRIVNQVRAAAFATLAAAQHQLKQTANAKASLASAREALQASSLTDGAGNLDGNWQDTLYARMLAREARELIEGKEARTP